MKHVKSKHTYAIFFVNKDDNSLIINVTLNSPWFADTLEETFNQKSFRDMSYFDIVIKNIELID